MNNLNPYNEEEFKEFFKKTNTYKLLTDDFEQLSWRKIFLWNSSLTPRQLAATGENRFSVVSFYYLQSLLEKNPEHIYDLGCGWNIFKKYIPNIIGIGAEYPTGPDFHGDIHDFVDEGFVTGHQNYFESVFSINALHYHPLDKMQQIFENFLSMIQPGGRGFLAINLMRLVERTDPETMLLLFNTVTPSENQYVNYIKNSLNFLNCKFLIVDIDLSTMDESMDGNIRIVIEKHTMEENK